MTRMTRIKRGLVVCLLMAMLVQTRSEAGVIPLPDPNFAVTLLPRPCAFEGGDPHEARLYEMEGWPGPEYVRYPGACQRMRFAFGPIVVKPGQNDVLIQPITIEKPWQNGYITRFKPNLVSADGTVPPTEQVHLHHGAWLSVAQDYGYGGPGIAPFFAAGEEKSIAPFPRGYGMPMKATDQWQMLYMVHSAVQQPMVMFITYDVDFVPDAAAAKLGLKPAYPLWLDVRDTAYPVFNVQRAFGDANGTCTWPTEQCAAFDPFGKTIEGQGSPGNGLGTDLALPAAGQNFGRAGPFSGGTLIGIGGHLHPGGLTNEIDLVRGGEARRIYTGEAVYWDKANPSVGGGPPTSWDYSERVLGLPYWGVHVEPGDVLRSNATYDTTYQSTYENMGIAVAFLSPDRPDGTPTAPGVDPFDAAVPVDHGEECPSRGLAASPPTLCTRGMVTHGHLKENDNPGGPSGEWSARRGLETSNVAIANFLYAPGDLSLLSMTGLPTVPLGSTLRFTNVDGALIYHTVTSCGFPCMGQTGISFPLSAGSTNAGRPVDFDSTELGIGLPVASAASGNLNWGLPVTAGAGYQPGEIVTYFCRIHPSMRGAFEVGP